MEAILESIRKIIPRPVLVILWIVLVLFVGLLDYYTKDFSLMILYTLLVALVTLLLGWWNGIAVSALGSLIGLVSDQLVNPQSGGFLPFFNAGISLLVYLLLAVIVNRLSLSLENVKSLSRTDFLTGASNRRYLSEMVDREIGRSGRTKRPFSFAYIDLDNFKSVNDRFGHSAGDELLKRMVQNMRHSVRNIDVVGRIGGDEFAVLFPETSRQNALSAMKRLREECAEGIRESYPDITFSAGLVTFLRCPRDSNEVFSTADSLMYRAKKEGKNRIVRGSK